MNYDVGRAKKIYRKTLLKHSEEMVDTEASRKHRIAQINCRKTS